MSPTKDVLTYEEIKTIEWWTEQGVPFYDTAISKEVADNIKPVLLRRNQKPWKSITNHLK